MRSKLGGDRRWRNAAQSGEANLVKHGAFE